MNQPKRVLKIDLDELGEAFDNRDIESYLNLETGEVVMITDDIRYEMDQVGDEFADSETGKVDWANVLPQTDLEDWLKEDVLKAAEAEDDDGARFIPIPAVSSHESYNDMVDFIASLPNLQLQDKLSIAINGKGAFRRFKDVLKYYPKEEQQWYKFKDARERERMLDWLASEDIELDETKDDN